MNSRFAGMCNNFAAQLSDHFLSVERSEIFLSNEKVAQAAYSYTYFLNELCNDILSSSP